MGSEKELLYLRLVDAYKAANPCLRPINEIVQRICGICHLYFPSKVALKKHGVVHKVQNVDEATETDEPEVLQTVPIRALPVVENIFDLLKSPFTDA